jgi:hypothetical protein
MDIKLFFFIASVVVGLSALVPYFRDIFQRRTEPHAYTWLIWVITQGTAAALSLKGGGGIGAISLIIAAAMNFMIFLLSFKYGTKNVTKSDTVILFAALLAIVVWWRLDQPLIAAWMITVIDFLGYVPSFRKSYQEPWSETAKSWVGFFFAMIFAILALEQYNSLTLPYVVMTVVCNFMMAAILLLRRRQILNPASAITK